MASSSSSFCYAAWLEPDNVWPLPCLLTVVIRLCFFAYMVVWCCIELKVFTTRFWRHQWHRLTDAWRRLRLVLGFFGVVVRSCCGKATLKNSTAYQQFVHNEPLTVVRAIGEDKTQQHEHCEERKLEKKASTTTPDTSEGAPSIASTPTQWMYSDVGFVDPAAGTCTICQTNDRCPMVVWRKLRKFLVFVTPVQVFTVLLALLGLFLRLMLSAIRRPAADDTVLLDIQQFAPPWNVVSHVILQAAVMYLGTFLCRRHMCRLAVRRRRRAGVRRRVCCFVQFSRSSLSSIQRFLKHLFVITLCFLISYGVAVGGIMSRTLFQLSSYERQAGPLFWGITLTLLFFVSLALQILLLYHVVTIGRERYGPRDIVTGTQALRGTTTLCPNTPSTRAHNPQQKLGKTDRFLTGTPTQRQESTWVWDSVADDGCGCRCCSATGTFRVNQQSRERWTQPWSVLTLSWLTPLLSLGRARALEFRDLFYLPKECRVTTLHPTFETVWNAQAPHGRASLVWAILKFGKGYVLFSGLMQLALCALTIATPLIIHNIVAFAEKCYASLHPSKASENHSLPGPLLVEGVRLVVLSALVHLGTTLVQQHYDRIVLRFGIQVRSALISSVYAKALRCRIDDLVSGRQSSSHHDDGPTSLGGRSREAVSGKLFNLMCADTLHVQDALLYAHTLWSSPLLVIVSFVYIWKLLGLATLSGIGVMVIGIPLTYWIICGFNKQRLALMALRDQRLKATQEAFAGIKTIKLQAWEKAFETSIVGLRVAEVERLWKNQLLIVAQRGVWGSAPSIIAFVGLATYVLLGNVMGPRTAFTAINLINGMRGRLLAFPHATSSCSFGWISCKRIQAFLLRDDVPDSKQRQPSRSSHPLDRSLATIIAHNLTLAWGGHPEHLSRVPFLHGVTFTARPGTLTIVAGATGTGKTGLAMALAGCLPPESFDTDGVSPSSLIVAGRVAYASQDPWIQNMTVRGNILFGKPFNAAWYQKILDASALTDDIAVFPYGDMTEIGDKALNLSGGQKQRINLARALYQSGPFPTLRDDDGPADIYILDDCFSMVDSTVAHHIFRKGILELLKPMNRTIILITNQHTFLPFADQIVLLATSSSGNEQRGDSDTQRSRGPSYVAAVGSYDHVQATQAFHTRVYQAPDVDASVAGSSEETERSEALTCPNVDRLLLEERTTPDAEQFKTLARPVMEAPDQSDDAAGKNLTGKETTEFGAVNVYVYWSYVMALGGALVVAIIIVGIALSQAFRVVSGFWLSYWSTADNHVPGVPTGAGVFALLGLAGIVLTCTTSIAVFWVSNRASRRLHHRLIARLFCAPMTFFESNSFGRLLNRLSSDLYAIDQILPSIMNRYISALYELLSTLIGQVIVTPLFIIAIVPFYVIYTSLQSFYMPGARHSQRLDLMLQSPLFSNIQETVDGILTVRASRAQQRFQSVNNQRLDDQQRAAYIVGHCGIWLTLRLECLGIVTAFIAGLLAVLGAIAGTIHPATAGLAVTFANQITSALTGWVSATIQREIRMVSVERVEKYSVCTPLEDASDAPSAATLAIHQSLPSPWPSAGRVVFTNYSMRYKPGLPLVLKNITLTISPNEKVGVVGRTGAGKTSMLMALYRLVEPAEGSIVIDGVDICALKLHELRSRLATIPQDSVLFTGTLRFNLDPFNEHDDPELWAAIESAHLRELVMQKFNGDLSQHVAQEGSHLSVGQRQLICLARALLRRSRLLIMDEATSAIDPTTDRLIQHTIREQFHNCTVLTVAHRLETVMDYDRIVVLDHGQIIETGCPRDLIQLPGGTFRKLCREAGVIRVPDNE